MKHRIAAIAFIPCLLFSVLLAVLPAPKVYADVNTASDISSAKFSFDQDRGHIVGDFGSSGKITFTDANVFDSTYEYQGTSNSPFCSPLTLTLTNHNFSASSLSANLKIGYLAGGNCKVVTRNNISVDNSSSVAQNYYAFNWSGSNIVYNEGSKTYTTLTNAPKNAFFNNNNKGKISPDQCNFNSVIVLDSGSTSTGTLYIFSNTWPGTNNALDNQKDNKPKQQGFVNNHCNIVTDPRPISIVGTQDSTSSGGSDGSGSTDSTNLQLTCDLGVNLSNPGAILLNPLNWLVCGVIKGLSLLVNKLDDAISSQLAYGTDGSTDQPTQVFDSTAYQQAWSQFRNIALGLLVVVAIIILIAQALGWEILDAYTIRKTLPRVLVAAIGITLSWQLMEFFVTLTNDLGYGVGNLISAPFANAGIHNVVLSGLGGGNGIMTSFIGFLGLTIFDMIGLLSFVGTAALAVFIAFIVLILRDIAITMLILFAPLAIVAYILPNTQKIYRFWWESFSKALLMFPLIVAFITLGRIFAALSISPGATGGG